MALPSNDFADLERAILRWLGETYQDEKLTAQANAATFHRREWTKVGYCVHFNVPRGLPRLDLRGLSRNWPLEGPGLESQDIHHGGGTLIWGSDGYIDCIEMYSFGDHFHEEVREFKLQTWERQDGA